jgi:hypothetical protein
MLLPSRNRLPKLYLFFVPNSFDYGLMVSNKWASRLRNANNFKIGVTTMGLLRTGIAGISAWKLGGGIISTILIFLVIYWLLGAFGMN